MDISIAKSILENILSNLQSFAEKKDFSLITSHVLLEAFTGQLVLKATDYEMGLQAVTDSITIHEEGKATVNAKKILDIVKRLKDEEVILKTDDGHLHIKQHRSNFKLPVFNAEEYPKFPDYESNPKIEINSSKLIQSIKKILPAIDNNNPKFELNGALIDIKEYSLNFVSTDTRRLAIVKFENPSIDKLSLIIPKKAIIEIQRLFVDEIELYYNESNLIIKSQNYLFFTKLINGHYPDYERIVPKETKFNLTLPKDKVIESIKLINSVATDMKMTIHPDHIAFESLNDENSEAQTECGCETGITEPFSIAVNSRYMLSFLEQTDTDDFLIGLNETNLPFTLKSDNFLTIVMPIIL